MQGVWPMRLFRALVLLSLVLGFAAPAQAQLNIGNNWPNPRLTVLTPTGGKPGTSVEVAFAGSELDDPEALVFSHPGIKGVPIIPPPPVVDPKAKPDPAKKIAPAPITKFTVTIAKDVPVGYHDVRFVNKFGVSNPRVFVVGDLVEVAEKEPNNEPAKEAQKIDIGTTVSGGIVNPTDVDFFVFAGKKGQRVLIHCLGASIDSRVMPEMRVFAKSSEKEIASDRATPGADGLLDVTLPADDEYLIRLNQFTYTAGGPEYFYRLNVSTGPWIDAVFPPMIEPGKTAQVTLYGRNLPGGKLDPASVLDGSVLEKLVVSIAAPADPALRSKLSFQGRVPPVSAMLDGFEYRFTGPTGVSNPVLITFAQAPVVIENDDNDVPEKAQAVPTPCEIAGRIDKKRDRDWYVFDAKKGDVFMIDLLSHRLGAPTDMYLSVRNLALKQEIVLLDDTADSLSMRMYTPNRDPAPYRFVAPADGKYHLLAASHTGDNVADPTCVYRLSIVKEKPDFRLMVMPADEHRPDTCVLGQGGAQHYTVYAQRTDGFKGEITLAVEGLPAGVTCQPQGIGGSLKFAHLVLAATDNAAVFTGSVKVVGTAVVNGQKVVHQARPATITWGVPTAQNIPTVTRLDRELALAVRDKSPGKLLPAKDKVVVSIGDKTEIPLKLVRVLPEFKANFQVTAVPVELPVGVTFANLTFAPGKDDVNAVLTIAANAAPGKYNIVFRGFATIAPNAKAKPVNTILTAPAVEVVVLPKQVATLTVDNANPTVKVGADFAMTVKVARLFDYADAFKVELVLPPNVKGVTADGLTIAPNASEAKMLLKAPPGTPPANLQNLIVRASAVVNGNVTLVHEIKINVNIVK